MENCIFCGNRVTQLPSNGAHIYLKCQKCGEYKITFPALSLDYIDKIKHLLAGLVFEKYFLDNVVPMIDTNTLKNQSILDNEKVNSKLFKLARYCYSCSKLNGVGSKIESLVPQCCYARNTKELYEYVNVLKEIRILNFKVIESLDANGNGPRIFSDIIMTVPAFMKFEKGIENVTKFENIFINKQNDNSRIEPINVETRSESMSITEFSLDDSWKIIEKDFNVTKVRFGKQIKFVRDQYKREIIFRDIAQALSLSYSGYNKPALILAGGVIEELLRLFIESKHETPARNTFESYITICEEKHLLKSNIRSLTDSARQFRNIVHLERELSTRETISKAAAKTAVSSIFTIVNDLE